MKLLNYLANKRYPKMAPIDQPHLNDVINIERAAFKVGFEDGLRMAAERAEMLITAEQGRLKQWVKIYSINPVGGTVEIDKERILAIIDEEIYEYM